jgi:hypothetical protein
VRKGWESCLLYIVVGMGGQFPNSYLRESNSFRLLNNFWFRTALSDALLHVLGLIRDFISRCHVFCGRIITMAKGTWILERTQDDRFPYRLQMMRGNKPWLMLRTQDRWPTAGRHIFCLREERPPEPDEVLKEVGQVDIAFNERGRRISIVLDRRRYKRCDFLFLKKSYKRKPGESYE